MRFDGLNGDLTDEWLFVSENKPEKLGISKIGSLRLVTQPNNHKYRGVIAGKMNRTLMRTDSSGGHIETCGQNSMRIQKPRITQARFLTLTLHNLGQLAPGPPVNKVPAQLGAHQRDRRLRLASAPKWPKCIPTASRTSTSLSQTPQVLPLRTSCNCPTLS